MESTKSSRIWFLFKCEPNRASPRWSRASERYIGGEGEGYLETIHKDMTPNSLMDMKRSHRYTRVWTYPDIIKELNNYYA